MAGRGQARLLDMGEVGAVRSMSLCHAVADRMRPEDHPAVLLVKPASPFVAGAAGPGAVGCAEEVCRERRIPLLRTALAGPAELHDGNRLLAQVVVPAGDPEGARWPAAADRPAHLGGALVAACQRLGLKARFRPPDEIAAAGGAVGGVRSGMLGTAHLGLAWLVIVRDDELEAVALGRPREAAPASDLLRGLGALPPLPSVAEALVDACETAWDLDLIPSMPTPAEMEGVYEWDRRLAAAEGVVSDPAMVAEGGKA